MRRFIATSCLALALAAASASVSAQDFTFGWNPRSGDVWVDVWLGDMNRYGSRYRDPFVDELVRYHGAPVNVMAAGMVVVGLRGWAAANAAELAAATADLARAKAEDALARLKRQRSEAVARGNRTRAAKNRARVIAKAQEMREALDSLSPSIRMGGRPIDPEHARALGAKVPETTEDETMADDPAQMPLGLG